MEEESQDVDCMTLTQIHAHLNQVFIKTAETQLAVKDIGVKPCRPSPFGS